MGDAYPVGPRVLAAIGAIGIGVFFGILNPLGLAEEGFPLTALVMALTALPLVAFLGALAAAPAQLQRVLSKFTRLNLLDAGHVAAAVIMAGTLYFVIGYGSLVGGAYAYEEVVRHGGEEKLAVVDGNALFQGLVFTVIILILPVVLYISFVHGVGPGGVLRALGLRAEDAVRGLLMGFAIAFGFLLAIILASAAATSLGVDMGENERALGIAKSVTLVGALGLAIGSSVSEEIFFRGFLQPRIGYWGQAIVFALAHLSYVNVLEVVVTFLLALAFGLVYKRTGNLWAPIGAHFLFNLVMLVIGIYAPTPEAA